MAKLTEDMKKMISEQLNFLSTADENGFPQVGPKGSMRVFDDTHLIYNEETAKQALHNLQDNGRAAVAVVDRPNLKGFRFEGTARLFDSGEIFDNAVAFGAERHLPETHYAVVIDIERIYKLDAGPTAGDMIAD
ncbi:sugar ABC transporter substrate-binding protein [Dellaglioa algida]|nr:sugar ABC transporter substrate-binding protein [Dellaglioa algida]